jgi:hypothetical protein
MDLLEFIARVILGLLMFIITALFYVPFSWTLCLIAFLIGVVITGVIERILLGCYDRKN